MARYGGEEIAIPPGLGKMVLAGAVVLVVLVVMGASVGTVSAGHRGVLLRFDAVAGILEEGLYFKIPFVDRVILMSTQIQKYTGKATSSSKDLQVVSTEVTLNYQLNNERVGEIYKNLRQDYESRIVQPFIEETVKSITAGFNAEELITKRPQVKSDLQELLDQKLTLPHGIKVVELSITDFQFSSNFQQAIEAKVTAVQEALEAENALLRVEFEAKQQITRARAEAEGLKLQRAHLTSQLIELRRIEVQKAAVEKWNGVMPSVVTGGGPVPMLDVFSKDK